jgi:hypothetical protein
MEPELDRSDGLSEQDLLLLAMDHLHACSHLFRIGPGGLASAGYLARLGIGLLLKALLLQRTGTFPAVDELELLAGECRTSGTGLRLADPQRDLLARLDRIYGHPYPDPDVAETIRAGDVETIHSLWHAIVDRLPQELISNLCREDEPE